MIQEPDYFNLTNTALKLIRKQIIMIDEHLRNRQIADSFKNKKINFEYQVWQTDHSFTNKRVSLINKVISFLDQ